MYMILVWRDDFLDCVKNKNGSIKLFEKLEEADKEADKINDSRVISIEGAEV